MPCGVVSWDRYHDYDKHEGKPLQILETLADAVRSGRFGYAIMIAERPTGSPVLTVQLSGEAALLCGQDLVDLTRQVGERRPPDLRLAIDQEGWRARKAMCIGVLQGMLDNWRVLAGVEALIEPLAI